MTNTHRTGQTPKIYAYIEGVENAKPVGAAVSEAGTLLHRQRCNSEHQAKIVLGVEKRGGKLAKNSYRQHYPDGFQVEYVPRNQVSTHRGLNDAIDLMNTAIEVS